MPKPLARDCKSYLPRGLCSHPLSPKPGHDRCLGRKLCEGYERDPEKLKCPACQSSHLRGPLEEGPDTRFWYFQCWECDCCFQVDQWN